MEQDFLDYRCVADFTANLSTRWRADSGIHAAIPALPPAAVEMYQALWNAPQLKYDREMVSHTFEVMSTARALEWAARDAERGQRNYLITESGYELLTHHYVGLDAGELSEP